MKKPLQLLASLTLLGSVLFLSGCIAQRSITTLKENPSAAATLAGMKFRVAELNVTNANASTLQQHLEERYPTLFSSDTVAIPLLLTLHSEPDNQMVGAVLTGLTLGIIPLPAHTGFSVDLGVTPVSAGGQSALPKSVVSYVRRDHGWMTILTPLGLIPIPGRSDIPRRSMLLTDEQGMSDYTKVQQALSEDSEAKAVVNALAAMDQTALRRLWQSRLDIPVIKTEIDGRRYEARLMPAFSKSMQQPGGADEYRLQIQAADAGGPRYSLPVASRDGSGWKVQRHYLYFASRPTVATALLEGGIPARGAIIVDDNPPLADFIDVPLLDGRENAGLIRWSNSILLVIKNRSLLNALHASSQDDLQQLMTRLESAILDLNERAARANDHAQQSVEKGDSPDALRELATLYRQRIEIIKPILQAVRQEEASRSTGSSNPS